MIEEFFDLLQLIVGSEDFDIRVFREDEIIAEMTETEVSPKNLGAYIDFFLQLYIYIYI